MTVVKMSVDKISVHQNSYSQNDS